MKPDYEYKTIHSSCIEGVQYHWVQFYSREGWEVTKAIWWSWWHWRWQCKIRRNKNRQICKTPRCNRTADPITTVSKDLYKGQSEAMAYLDDYCFSCQIEQQNLRTEKWFRKTRLDNEQTSNTSISET